LEMHIYTMKANVVSRAIPRIKMCILRNREYYLGRHVASPGEKCLLIYIESIPCQNLEATTASPCFSDGGGGQVGRAFFTMGEVRRSSSSGNIL
uniref:Uncharacterized protein n=1 Tax=Podarcis muralis TaxID=64176 RepID=A0A670KCY8_PODMU